MSDIALRIIQAYQSEPPWPTEVDALSKLVRAHNEEGDDSEGAFDGGTEFWVGTSIYPAKTFYRLLRRCAIKPSYGGSIYYVVTPEGEELLEKWQREGKG